jgi:hypothetical protein
MLDIELMGDFRGRIDELFAPVTVRAYAAALIGRLQQRAAHGAHRTYPLPANVATLLANNDSRDRALLVYADVAGTVPTPVVYSSSNDSGANNYQALQSQAPGAVPERFVLLPSEQLFGRAPVQATAVISTEWF